MNFYDHILLYNFRTKKESIESFYKKQMDSLIYKYKLTQDRHIITAYNQSCAELSWSQNNKPYYKIFPNLLPMFIKTNLSVLGKYLHAPFPNFLIRLSEHHECEELTVNGHELQTILVTEVDNKNVIALNEPITYSHMFIVWMNFGEKYHNVPYYIFQVMKFKKEETIEEALASQRTPDKIDTKTLSIGLDIGDNKINNCMRVVVSTCFLATGADRIVEPEVLNKDLQKYIESHRHNDKETIEKLHNKAQKRGKKGWTLGREIPLISRYKLNDNKGITDTHLKYQHQRGAHFHVYHYGPKKSKWKVRWINQLTVRPDLPLPEKTKRGYVTK